MGSHEAFHLASWHRAELKMLSALLLFTKLNPHLAGPIIVASLTAGTMYTDDMGKDFSITARPFCW